MSIGRTLPPSWTVARLRPLVRRALPRGRDRGSARRQRGGMPTSPPRKHVVLIDQMTAEWQSIGRARPAVAALQRVATRDPALSELVLGTGGRPARRPTPCDP